MSHIPNLHRQQWVTLTLKKKTFPPLPEKKDFILAESRDIVDYRSTNAQSVQILSRLTPKMTRFVLPYMYNKQRYGIKQTVKYIKKTGERTIYHWYTLLRVTKTAHNSSCLSNNRCCVLQWKSISTVIMVTLVNYEKAGVTKTFLGQSTRCMFDIVAKWS